MSAIRLRFGNGHRDRFEVPEGVDVERRTAQLKALAKALKSLPEAEARLILKRAAGAASEAAFQEVRTYALQLPGVKGAATPKGGETFQELAERWTSGKLAKKHPDHVKLKQSAASDVLRLSKLYPTIGAVPLRSFTLDHAERAMLNLPKTARRPAARRHYAQLIRRVLALAVYPCRILEHNPLPRGFLPKLGPKLEKNWLYPSEESALLRCGEIPLLRRALYGFCAREGTRISEALALTWQDVDLERGVLTLQEPTKTKTVRAWKLSPGVAEALTAIRGKAPPESAVFPLSHARKDAEIFRLHLKLAGIKRPELFKTTDSRLRIRIHDTRTTFITIALANGRSETWVQDRTGHKSSQQIAGYRQGARRAAELNLGDLEPLNKALGLGPKVGQSGPGNETNEGETIVNSEKCAREGSNLHALRRWNLNPLGNDTPTNNTEQNEGLASGEGAAESTNEHVGPSKGTEQAGLEQALAEALRAATAAGAWSTVAEIARALEARAQTPNCETCGQQLARYAGPGAERGWTCVSCEVQS